MPDPDPLAESVARLRVNVLRDMDDDATVDLRRVLDALAEAGNLDAIRAHERERLARVIREYGTRYVNGFHPMIANEIAAEVERA